MQKPIGRSGARVIMLHNVAGIMLGRGYRGMGWENRRNGTYYYRAKRIGNRVVREYVGAGRVAELAAQLDAIETGQRDKDRQAFRESVTELAALDIILDTLDESAELVARAALLAAGFCQHNRGEWRKPRGQPDQAE